MMNVKKVFALCLFCFMLACGLTAYADSGRESKYQAPNQVLIMYNSEGYAYSMIDITGTTVRWKVLPDGTMAVYNSSGTTTTVIGSDGRTNLATPVNLMKNVALAVWSGATCDHGAHADIRGVFGSGVSGPDGWMLKDGANSSVTRIDVADTKSGSGSTVYPGHTHAILISNSSSLAYRTKDYLAYPGSGVSNNRDWYQQFHGKRVMFGAWVYTDVNVGGATDFIRPYILTDNISFVPTDLVVSHAGTSCMAFGDYSDGGWDFLSVTTDVPTAETADAFECGFQIDGTGSTSPTAFITGPVLLIGNESTDSIPKPHEIVWFDHEVIFGPQSGGGSNNGGIDLGDAGTSSFNLESGTSGRIPSDVEALYVKFYGVKHSKPVAEQCAIWSTTPPTNGGASIYPVPHVSISGTSQWMFEGWVQCDSEGDFDLYSGTSVTGASIFITGAQIR